MILHAAICKGSQSRGNLGIEERERRTKDQSRSKLRFPAWERLNLPPHERVEQFRIIVELDVDI